MSFDATLTWWFTAILAVISLFALISTRSVSRRESLMQGFTDAVVLPVGILSWIACSAVVYAVATGVDPGSPFTDGIVPQLSGLGMLSIVYFAAFRGGKKHFRFRLWPDIDAVNTSGLTA